MLIKHKSAKYIKCKPVGVDFMSAPTGVTLYDEEQPTDENLN